MEVVVVGTGYVGLVTGACLADIGHHVTCIDKDESKINALSNGVIPIYEPGLEDIVARNTKVGSLQFATQLDPVIHQADLVFLAVGTPTNADNGSADLTYIFKAVEDIINVVEKEITIVTKSTVPVGTGRKIRHFIQQHKPHLNCAVISNPEFLREGSAIQDFMHPDRIIVGTSSLPCQEKMKELYAHFIQQHIPLVMCDIPTAELIKYASNAYLATKISFINEIADICEKTNATIDNVIIGMGLDKRIGKQHLYPGPGFGGSCFPKDTRALSFTGHEVGAPSKLIDTVIASNEQRKHHMVDKIIDALDGSVKGKTLSILGTAFKANTDDMRESASLVIIPKLIELGATIRAYDPAAMEEAKPLLPDSVIWCHNSYDTMQDADATIIITEWPEFAALDLNTIKEYLKDFTIIDLRNIFEPRIGNTPGLKYVSIGRTQTYEQHEHHSSQ